MFQPNLAHGEIVLPNDQKTSSIGTGDNQWEYACPLEECIAEIRLAAKYVQGTFRLGAYGRERAARVQEVANSQARCREHQNPDFHRDWFDNLSNEDRFFWAVGGTDCFVDLLTSAVERRDGHRFLLPDVTDREVESRKNLLEVAIREQTARGMQPEAHR